ncbi:MAG: toxin TcdB middle/N-terminal domain-containing protein, partial [Myxococcota bacterium]
DGLLDAVKLSVGSLRYKLNLGWGHWGEEVEVFGLPLEESELDVASLEDLNGDGLSDLVVVVGRTVKLAINRNGTEFSGITAITDESIEGNLPLRDGTTTVLFADMNGNGSSDVVWLSAQGDATYLEMFPVRPNQLARIENGLGMVTEITYGTSVQHMARDGGWEAWEHRLPHPMLVVDAVDRYDLLTNVHEVTEFRYHDGFYDGVEKQFRGYARVETIMNGDETQEDGLTLSTYDVGATDPYRNGLMLSQVTSSGDRDQQRILNSETTTYEDCDVAQVPSGTALPIRFICSTAKTQVIQEGTAPEEHVTLESTMEYDGYGNVIRSSNFGVTRIGGQGCAPCQANPAPFGAPCGEQCLGDESYTETSYVVPGDDTSGRWILNYPFREVSYGRPGSPVQTETLTYYDGEDFVGMNLGSLDQGNVTRVTQAKDTDSVVTVMRSAYDSHGQVVESIDPLGQVGGSTHRRRYTYDTDNLRILTMDLYLEDSQGNPYQLRREMNYEPAFDNVVENTAVMQVVDGQVVSARRSTSYNYDQFGRIISTVLPGEDNVDNPSQEYTYDQGSPVSRIISRYRSEEGQAYNFESIQCFDGRGRVYQTRIRITDGLYQVNGFSIFNTRGSTRRVYQPYNSSSPECDLAPPEGTLFSTVKRDATFRELENTRADGSIYGSASVARTVYMPLATHSWDAEDTDPSSVHSGTPTIIHTDGLGRTVAIERTLAETNATTQIHYSELGFMTGYTDADGYTKTQTFDLLGRVLEVDDPNCEGKLVYTYDDAGNTLQTVDPRGITTAFAYDGLNRLVEKWDAADRDGTLIRWDYDAVQGCDTCVNSEGLLAQVTYPGPKGLPGIDQLGYDARGRLVLSNRQLAGMRFDLQFDYDNAGRLLSTTYPDGQTIPQTYDDASRLTSISG